MEHERRIPADVRANDALRRALNDWQASVMRLDAMDATTTELVRLRAAANHDCRVCRSLRLVDARDAGVDDTMIAKIERYERSDLDDRHKVALRLADAMMTQPNGITPELRADLRRHFTDEQILELTLDVMKWNYQKVPVALRADVPMPVGTGLGFDADGNALIVGADGVSARR